MSICSSFLFQARAIDQKITEWGCINNVRIRISGVNK
jgi:hypothetical protein